MNVGNVSSAAVAGRKKRTWRRKGELSLPSLQCHTRYSGLTALSNRAECLQGWQREGSTFKSMLEKREKERVMPLAAHFKPKQMDGNSEGRILLPVYHLLKPKVSERLQAHIFTFWKSPDSVYE